MDAFLSPIEKPQGFILKFAYFFSKKLFGKVLGSLKIHSARLPAAFGLFYSKVSQLDKKLELSQETALLIRQHVAQLNICLFCIDIGRFAAIKASVNVAKFDALNDYATSPLFTEAERSALDYATELTKNKKGDPGLFKKMAAHYTERELCEIVWLVASEHLYNITNLGMNIHSDMLCDISRKK